MRRTLVVLVIRDVAAANGNFSGGRATAAVSAFACAGSSCDDAGISTTRAVAAMTHMRRIPMKRLALLISILATLALGATPVAAAAHPGNDLPTGATVVLDSLPQSIVQDTSSATVSRKDDVGCGAGGLDQATVWYKFTPSSDKTILVDASASSYAVGTNVFDSVADPNHLIACSGGPVIFDAVAGTTYYLMFADADGDTTNGGTLRATVDVAPPPIAVTLTVDPSARLSNNGATATISGTAACNRTADFSEVDAFLTQTVGRFKIVGSGFAESTCGPTATTWSMDIPGDTGRFSGGSIVAQVSAFACDAFSCGDAFVEVTLRVRH
jgi:hypothetical protein